MVVELRYVSKTAKMYMMETSNGINSLTSISFMAMAIWKFHKKMKNMMENGMKDYFMEKAHINGMNWITDVNSEVIISMVLNRATASYISITWINILKVSG